MKIIILGSGNTRGLWKYSNLKFLKNIVSFPALGNLSNETRLSSLLSDQHTNEKQFFPTQRNGCSNPKRRLYSFIFKKSVSCKAHLFLLELTLKMSLIRIFF